MRLITDAETHETPALERRETATESVAAIHKQAHTVDAVQPVVETAIEYTLADFSRYYALISGWKRSSDLTFSCGFAAAVLFYAAVDTCLHHNYGAAAAFVLFGAGFGYWAAHPMTAPRHWLKRWKRSMPTGTFHLTIGENGMRTLGAHAEGSYNWSYFSLAWEDAELFGVTNCDQFVVLIPRRYLTAEQADALRALFQRQVPWWADINATRRGSLRKVIQQVRKQTKAATEATKKAA